MRYPTKVEARRDTPFRHSIAVPSSEPSVVGLIPAAGQARRLGRLPCSKELLPIAPARVAIDVVLARFADAGIGRAYVLMDGAKGDLPRYLAEPALGPPREPSLAFIAVTGSPSVPHTLDRAYPFVSPEPAPWVALGFPDVLFGPADAFRHLVDRRRRTGAAVVLGLFPARDPGSTDMVETGPGGEVRRIELRPRETHLQLAWLLALWDLRFTDFLHRRLRHPGAQPAGELQLGHLFGCAAAEGLEVQSVAFRDGWFRDLGTPEGYAEALRDGFAG